MCGSRPTFRASFILFHGTPDFKDLAREPSILGFENCHTACKKTLERMTCVITRFSGVNKFVVWILRIQIRSELSHSRYDPNSIWIDFGCSGILLFIILNVTTLRVFMILALMFITEELVQYLKPH